MDIIAIDGLKQCAALLKAALPMAPDRLADIATWLLEAEALDFVVDLRGGIIGGTIRPKESHRATRIKITVNPMGTSRITGLYQNTPGEATLDDELSTALYNGLQAVYYTLTAPASWNAGHWRTETADRYGHQALLDTEKAIKEAFEEAEARKIKRAEEIRGTATA